MSGSNVAYKLGGFSGNMAVRAYRRLKVDEIDQLLKDSNPDDALLRAVLEELGYRTTAKAQELMRRVEALLNGKAAPAGKQTAGPQPHQLKDEQPTRPVSSTTTSASTPRQSSEPIPKGPVDGTSNKISDESRQEQPPRAESSKPQRPTEPRPRQMPDTPKRELTPEQARVTQVIDYVRTLVELGDKPVWSLASYKNVVLHELDLCNRIGIRHDLSDEDGPVYLKVDRLQRIDPP